MTKSKKESKEEKPQPTAGKHRGVARAKKRLQELKARRPHRTFRLTKRRDYKRPAYIEGYLAFTAYVLRTLWHNKRLFIIFILVYATITALFVGMTSHENYRLVGEYVDGVLKESSSTNPLTEATVLFGVSLTGTLTDVRSEGQQLFGAFLILFGWLTVVWLLRQIMAGHKVRVRDGLYSAGAPIIATFVLMVVILIQALPFLLGLLIYALLASVGLFQSGVEAMMAWIALILLAAMSLYWITASLMGMVIVTLPGIYPFVALKKASDLVLGRRLGLMMRIVWALLVLFLIWVIVLFPLILLDMAVRVEWLSLVPVGILLLSSFSVVWFSAYAYLLYRRLIDGETAAS